MNARLHGLGETVLRVHDRARMVHQMNGDAASAEQWLEAAVSTARSQSALLYELRATTELAKLLAAQGHRDDGARRLTNVCAAFAEGQQAPDLIAAKLVLDRLASQRA